FLGSPSGKERLFYFGSYEGLHTEQTSVITSPLVPVDQREWPNPTTDHQGFAKIDDQVSNGQSISGRYRIDRNLQRGNGIGGLNTHDRGSDSLTRDQDGVVSDTLVLSNRALNELPLPLSQR